uniref:Transposase n=1 Tax=Peronospora matthiolae TaxID=2874970 RepID=A0AAV1TL87_9STRA
MHLIEHGARNFGVAKSTIHCGWVICYEQLKAEGAQSKVRRHPCITRGTLIEDESQDWR